MSKKLPDHLFTSTDGSLYDTRRANWNKEKPLRAIYCRTYSAIENTKQLRATLRNGGFAWPGGYPMFFICDDGGALAFETVRANLRSVLWSIRNNCADGWKVCGVSINYEDNELTDAHTGKPIEPAYRS